MTIESDFEIKVYLILSTAYGKLDLVLRDAITSIRETGQGTQTLNRYDYEEAEGEES